MKALFFLLPALAIAIDPPTMPLVFSTNRFIQEDEGPQRFTWQYDWATQQEKMVFSSNPNFPPNTTLLYIYHGKWVGKGTKCFDTNDCATIYTWGPNMPCTGMNTSNTMEILFGWLNRDEFTNQSATYIGRDEKRDCALWLHNSDPDFPKVFNQTACIAHTDKGSSPVPVYMHYHQKGTAEFEVDEYTGFHPLGSSFPAGTFDHPKNCPVSAGVPDGVSNELQLRGQSQRQRQHRRPQ